MFGKKTMYRIEIWISSHIQENILTNLKEFLRKELGSEIVQKDIPK